jgi:ribosome modulation factor
MREDGYFEGYEEEEINTDLIKNIISEFWNECDWLSFSTEEYDHKRGYATCIAEVMVPYNDVVKAEDWMLTGWRALVHTELGTLEIK